MPYERVLVSLPFASLIHYTRKLELKSVQYEEKLIILKQLEEKKRVTRKLMVRELKSDRTDGMEEIILASINQNSYCRNITDVIEIEPI